MTEVYSSQFESREKLFLFDFLKRFADSSYTYEKLVSDLCGYSYDEMKIHAREQQEEHQNDFLNYQDNQHELKTFIVDYFSETLERAGLNIMEKGYLNEGVGFKKGTGLGPSNDVVRFYFNPRLDERSLKLFIDEFVSVVQNALVPTCEGKFHASEFLMNNNNRFLLYIDQQSTRGLSDVLRRISQSQSLLDTLQEDGGWATGLRIPIAKGLSFVEGGKESWDSTTLETLETQTQFDPKKLQQLGRHPVMFQLRLR